ncbi:MAG: 50S ribosomal protein L30e [Methanoregulaceae archaeon]|nr:50S ribosomal protein L30e [Methanoregulaceae archaeon]
MDFNASLRRAIKTGVVLLGQNKTEKCINEGKAQIVVVAKNSPTDFKASLAGKEDLFVYIYDGSSVALGKACGKPYMVSALVVIDPGESDILALRRA